MSSYLASLGWDSFFSASFEPYSTDHVPGRVARVDRSAVDALTPSGPRRCRFSARATVPAVGDWVAVSEPSGSPAQVAAVLDRRTAMTRAVKTGESEHQVLAANVDVVFVVVPAVPEPKPATTERLVALAWESGAMPVVVLTKCDLTADPDGVAADLADAAPGVDVVALGLGEPVDEALAPYLSAGRTGCLIGRSGAGKSTLANRLLGSEWFATGAIRDDGKGRHTTVHRELVPLPTGGLLVDTPGLRAVGMGAGDEGLQRAFPEIEELAQRCRFGDCGHVSEPGCAVLGAVDGGMLPQRRLDSWRKLQREAAWMASRRDARLRSEQRRNWKILQNEVRRSGRVRP